MSEPSSKIVVFGLELQQALKAAIAITPTKPPHDVLQFRFSARGGDMLVCGRDPLANMAVTVSVGTTMDDLIPDRDEVVEITRASALMLLSKKVIKEDPEDEPMVGLIITGEKITSTDESGLGLGIRQVRVRRAVDPDGGTAVGNIEKLMATASESLPGETASLTPKQWKHLSAIAAAVGVDVEVRPLEAAPSGLTRVLIVGDRLAIYAAHLPEGQPAQSTTSDEEADDPLDLFFGDSEAIKEAAATALGNLDNVRVLRANPPKGFA